MFKVMNNFLKTSLGVILISSLVACGLSIPPAPTVDVAYDPDNLSPLYNGTINNQNAKGIAGFAPNQELFIELNKAEGTAKYAVWSKINNTYAVVAEEEVSTGLSFISKEHVVKYRIFENTFVQNRANVTAAAGADQGFNNLWAFYDGVAPSDYPIGKATYAGALEGAVKMGVDNYLFTGAVAAEVDFNQNTFKVNFNNVYLKQDGSDDQHEWYNFNASGKVEDGVFKEAVFERGSNENNVAATHQFDYSQGNFNGRLFGKKAIQTGGIIKFSGNKKTDGTKVEAVGGFTGHKQQNEQENNGE